MRSEDFFFTAINRIHNNILESTNEKQCGLTPLILNGKTKKHADLTGFCFILLQCEVHIYTTLGQQ